MSSICYQVSDVSTENSAYFIAVFYTGDNSYQYLRVSVMFEFGLGCKNRICGLSLPKRALYQAELIRVNLKICIAAHIHLLLQQRRLIHTVE